MLYSRGSGETAQVQQKAEQVYVSIQSWNTPCLLFAWQSSNSDAFQFTEESISADELLWNSWNKSKELLIWMSKATNIPKSPILLEEFKSQFFCVTVSSETEIEDNKYLVWQIVFSIDFLF